MRAEIISVGTELLLGDIVNTNAQFLARELASLGFTVYYQSVVGDNPMRLRSLVHQAKERSEVLIFTGGLGPTDDDLTKETVAEAFGDSLIHDADELAKLEAFYKKLGRPMAPNNRKQAMVPRRGLKLNNPHGTAPGAMFRQGGKYAFLLPGPPREMKPMFENEVQPVLEAMQDGAIRSHTLHVVGMGESDVEVKLKDFVGGTNPTVALYAKDSEVHVRVTAKAQTPQQADHVSLEMSKLVQEVLGDIVYSNDGSTLPKTVVELLQANDESIALAESCTGGLLAERITTVAGASSVFGYGVVSYANETKHKLLKVRNKSLSRFGAVSSQVCAEMSFGAAKQGNATYGVAITGIAGPDGGSTEKPVGLVYVGVCKGNNVWIRKLNIPGRSRDYVRYSATQNALDMLRRLVLGLEIPGAKCFAENQHADFEREGRAQRRGTFILRVLGGILLAILFLAAMLFASTFWQSGSQEQSAMLLPSEQGLHYGSEEYNIAVQQLLVHEQEANPAIDGFVAFPDALVETFVLKSQQEQADLTQTVDEPLFNELATVGKNANLQSSSENVLLFGGSTFRPLMELAQPENISKISSFTCFTDSEALEYLVFAVAYVEEDAPQDDGFNPALQHIHSYTDYLTFVLGAKGRSLYTISLDVQKDDSFMTLQTQDPNIPGQSLFLFGRLRRPGETADASKVQPAGQPLMPLNFYEEQGYPVPDIQENYERWLQDFLSQDMTNMQLQLNQGIPTEDTTPTVVLYPEVVPEVESTDASTETEQDAQAAQPEEEAVSVAALFQMAPTINKSLPQDVGPQATKTTASAVSSSINPSTSTASQSVSDVTQDTANSLPQSEEPQQEEESQPPQPVIQRPDPRFLVVRMNGVLVRDTATNILAAICQYEVANAPTAVIETQAVATHSWILNQQGSNNPAPAVRGAAPSADMRDIVEPVSSLVLSADGYNPAFTPWFASAAGGTNSAQDLFSVDRSYLRQLPAENEQGMARTSQEIEISETEMLAMLSAWPGLDAENLAEPENWFAGLEHNESGYVVSLEIAGETLSGLELWQTVLQKDGSPLLQSPAFTVDFNGNSFYLRVYGEGHGCGLSQAGAIQFAQQDNQSSEQILAHYFPQTELIEWT